MNQALPYPDASAGETAAVSMGPRPLGKHDPLARQRAVVAMGRRASPRPTWAF